MCVCVCVVSIFSRCACISLKVCVCARACYFQCVCVCVCFVSVLSSLCIPLSFCLCFLSPLLSIMLPEQSYVSSSIDNLSLVVFVIDCVLIVVCYHSLLLLLWFLDSFFACVFIICSCIGCLLAHLCLVCVVSVGMFGLCLCLMCVVR